VIMGCEDSSLFDRLLIRVSDAWAIAARVRL